MTEPSMENLAWYALNHRIAPQHLASKELDALEEFVSKMCIAASDRWREEWSEQCNDNQILSNTCDESLAFIKELTQERDALAAALAEIAQTNPYDTSTSCQTCENYTAGGNAMGHKCVMHCTNGDQYQSAPKVVLWRTE